MEKVCTLYNTVKLVFKKIFSPKLIFFYFNSVSINK